MVTKYLDQLWCIWIKSRFKFLYTFIYTQFVAYPELYKSTFVIPIFFKLSKWWGLLEFLKFRRDRSRARPNRLGICLSIKATRSDQSGIYPIDQDALGAKINNENIVIFASSFMEKCGDASNASMNIHTWLFNMKGCLEHLQTRLKVSL